MTSILAGAWLAAVLVSQTFDAASVKPVPFGVVKPIDYKFLPGRFVATNVTLGQLIALAYGIDRWQLTGGPPWFDEVRFDVVATTGERASREQAMSMLKSLLADRFKLVVATESKSGTAYTLVSRDVHGFSQPAKPDERPLVALSRESTNGFLSYHYDGHNATITQLVSLLAQHVYAPVTDGTGLTSHYDFRIDWTYDSAFGGLEPDPNIPTIFTALQKQVGLQLVAGKGPFETLAIQAASRLTEN